MENKIKNLDFCAAVFMFAVMTVLISVFAPFRIGFKEQIGIFFLSPERISWYLSNPAVLATVSGDWLTQFYYHNATGVVITVVLLFILWVGIKRLLKLAGLSNQSYAVALLPVVTAGAFIIMPNYPVSELVGLIIAVWTACGFCHIRKPGIRTVCIGLAIPILFVLIGGNTVTFALICLFLKGEKLNQVLISVVIGLVVMALLVRLYNLSYLQAVLFPVVQVNILPRPWVMLLLPLSVIVCLLLSCLRKTGFPVLASVLCSVLILCTSFRDPVFEFSFKIGSIAYKTEDWSLIRSEAEKHTDTLYGLFYRNLSYAREGKLPDALLDCNQSSDSEGLFLITGYNENYLSTFYFIDALLEMGDLSQAIDCALIGQSSTPGHCPSRIMHRLAEISVTAGDYKVASKYLNILSRTRRHREWAENLLNCIDKDSIPEKYLVWRSRTSGRDRFFGLGAMRASLNTIAADSPMNKVAIDYLMCSCLLDGNMDAFLNLYDRFWLNGLDHYHQIPALYEEALLMNADSDDSLKETVKRYSISQNTVDRYLSFLDIVLNPEKENRGIERFRKSYWYYTMSVGN